jgi:hypothetical protein
MSVHPKSTCESAVGETRRHIDDTRNRLGSGGTCKLGAKGIPGLNRMGTEQRHKMGWLIDPDAEHGSNLETSCTQVSVSISVSTRACQSF